MSDSVIANHNMEPNEQQFYELDDAGQPVQSAPAGSASTPPAKPNRSWLMYVLIVIVLVVVGTFVFLFIRSLFDGSGELSQRDMDTVYESIKDDLEACEQDGDPEYCMDRVWIDAAKSRLEASICFEAKDEDAAEGCVEEIAFTADDEDICALLDGEDREDCSDNILYDDIVHDLDYEGCSDLHEASLVQRCQLAIESEVSQQGGCAAAGVRPVLCDDQIWLQEAVASGDFKACNWLATTEGVESCKDTFHSTDADGDTLSLYEEYEAGTSDTSSDTDGDGLSDVDELGIYETDPTNADTDGDGYSDGEEVANGFDPLNAGGEDEE